MSVRSDVELMRVIPLFSGVEPSHLEVLLFSSARRTVRAGEVLMAKGVKGDRAFLVLSGTAQVFDSDADDPIALVERGAFLGELAMLAKLEYPVTVVATSDLVVRDIGHDVFVRLCREFPESARQILDAVAGKLETTISTFREVQVLFDQAKSFRRL
jgi:CRP/FNR family transcriptional regulator, cyclic AMP receptor protein